MLKKTIYLIPLLFLANCGESNPPSSVQVNNHADSIQLTEEDVFEPMQIDTLRGVYKGSFDNGTISVVITYINGNKAVGYNVHRGLQRNLFGDVIEKKDKVLLTLSEPGDHEYDGVFHLEINKKDFGMSGTWMANNPRIGDKIVRLSKKIVKEEEYGKEGYTAVKITEANFLEYFGDCGFEAGDFEFSEDGLVVFHWLPRNTNGSHTKQEVTINGSWDFAGTNTITVEWQPNKFFKKLSGYFELIYDDNDFPQLKIEGDTIYPMYY